MVMSDSESTGFAIVPHVLWQTMHPRDVAVYCALASFADYNSGLCWPSRSTIAEMLGVSVKTIDRSIHKLERAGFIRKSRRKDSEGDWTSNLYELPFAVGARFRGRDKDVATYPQKRPGGRDTNVPQMRPMNDIWANALKIPTEDCAHRAADEDGYCTACGSDDTR